MYDHDVFVNDDEICLNDFTVHWGSFSHLVCGLVQYNISLYLGISKVDDVVTFNTSHNFTNLQMDTAYIFTVFGSNVAGNGGIVVKTIRTSRINGNYTDITLMHNYSDSIHI